MRPRGAIEEPGINYPRFESDEPAHDGARLCQYSGQQGREKTGVVQNDAGEGPPRIPNSYGWKTSYLDRVADCSFNTLRLGRGRRLQHIPARHVQRFCRRDSGAKGFLLPERPVPLFCVCQGRPLGPEFNSVQAKWVGWRL